VAGCSFEKEVKSWHLLSEPPKLNCRSDSTQTYSGYLKNLKFGHPVLLVSKPRHFDSAQPETSGEVLRNITCQRGAGRRAVSAWV